jgi:hypothetical protein
MTMMRFRSLQPRLAERRTPQDDVSTILARHTHSSPCLGRGLGRRALHVGRFLLTGKAEQSTGQTAVNVVARPSSSLAGSKRLCATGLEIHRR